MMIAICKIRHCQNVNCLSFWSIYSLTSTIEVKDDKDESEDDGYRTSCSDCHDPNVNAQAKTADLDNILENSLEVELELERNEEHCDLLQPVRAESGSQTQFGALWE